MLCTIRPMILSALVLPLALFFPGCGPTQQEMMARDHLEKARSSYAQAQADPQVEAYASLALSDAGKTLAAAEKASDWEEMNHLAYLTERETQIASAIARIKIARQQSDQLRSENEQLIEKLSALARSRPDPEAAKKEERAAELERRQGGLE